MFRGAHSINNMGSHKLKYYNACYGKEIDLRKELEGLFHGSSENYKKSWPFVYRRLTDKRCTCWNNLAREGDPRCPYCLGEPYLWSYEIHKAYAIVTAPIYGKSLTTQDAPFQKMVNPSALLFLEHNINPKNGDVVLEVWLDSEGKIKAPIKLLKKWRIGLIEEKRADHGRVEFYKLSMKMEPL